MLGETSGNGKPTDEDRHHPSPSAPPRSRESPDTGAPLLPSSLSVSHIPSSSVAQPDLVPGPVSSVDEKVRARPAIAQFLRLTPMA